MVFSLEILLSNRPIAVCKTADGRAGFKMSYPKDSGAVRLRQAPVGLWLDSGAVRLRQAPVGLWLDSGAVRLRQAPVGLWLDSGAVRLRQAPVGLWLDSGAVRLGFVRRLSTLANFGDKTQRSQFFTKRKSLLQT
jgi:hypothetical protein